MCVRFLLARVVQGTVGLSKLVREMSPGRHVALALGFLLLGCGGPSQPDFTGYYTGTLFSAQLCSDGTMGSVSAVASWKITEAADLLTIDPMVACGPYTAKVIGSEAQIQPKVCPTQTSGGSTYSVTVTGGSLVLMSGLMLSVSLPLETTVTGSRTASCRDNYGGTLQGGSIPVGSQ